VRGTSASSSTVGQVKQIVYNPFKIEMKEIVKGKKKCLEKCKYDVDEKKLSYFIMLKKKNVSAKQNIMNNVTLNDCLFEQRHENLTKF